MVSSGPQEALYKEFKDAQQRWWEFVQPSINVDARQPLTDEQRARERELYQDITDKHRVWVKSYLNLPG